MIGLTCIILLLIVLSLKVPVGIALILVGFIGYGWITSPKVALMKLGADPFHIVHSYSLSVVPMFLLMGLFLGNAGYGRDLFKSFHVWLGNIPGGLAVATIGTCAAFAAVSGSVIATTAAITRVTVPEMLKFNYKRSFAVGTATAGSTLGILIPPSGVLVVYGVLSEESIGSLLIAGIIPGILTAFLLVISIFIQLRLRPDISPGRSISTFSEKISSLKYVWPVPVIFFITMGGIYFGIFTPTEAGAAGAFAAFIISVLSGRVKLPGIVEVVKEAARITTMIMLIVVGGFIFGHFLAVSRIPIHMADYMIALDIPPYLLMIFVFFIYFISGFFMEEFGTLVIYTPLFYPLIIAAGYDGVWYGIVTILMLLIGLLTPPVGVVSLVASSVTNIPTNEVFQGVFPFWIALIVSIGILIAFPDIALYLPDLMRR